MRSISSSTPDLCVFEKQQNETFPFIDHIWYMCAVSLLTRKPWLLVGQSGPQGKPLLTVTHSLLWLLLAKSLLGQQSPSSPCSFPIGRVFFLLQFTPRLHSPPTVSFCLIFCLLLTSALGMPEVHNTPSPRGYLVTEFVGGKPPTGWLGLRGQTLRS